MIGIDAVALFVFVLKFNALFTTRASIYLYALSEHYLVYWVISLLLLGIYLGLSLGPKTRTNALFRFGIIGFLGVFLIGSLVGIQVAARLHSQPYRFIHDGAVQSEDAINALAAGENPYAVDYRTRTFGAFPDTFSESTRPNPAWTHHVYLPLQVALGVPLHWLSERLLGWFDIRLLYLALFVMLVAAAMLLRAAPERRILALIFLLFNPLFAPFLVSGFNDVFFLGWVAFGVMLLQRKRFALAGLALGAAFASKQSAWFLIPFYLVHLYATADAAARWKAALRRAFPAVLLALAVLLPFVLWSPLDFVDDTIGYATGGSASSYPISGFGIGQLLLSMGYIRSMWDQYPFWVIQLVLGVPLLAVLVRWQLRNPTVSRMLTAYGVLAFALWFASRYFNDSYLAVLSVIFILAYAAHEQDEAV